MKHREWDVQRLCFFAILIFATVVRLKGLTGGNSVIVYGQTELTRDLYEGRDRLGGIVIHNADDVKPHDFDTPHPCITYRESDEIVRSTATS